MKIVKVESLEEMTMNNVYFEFENEFYVRCSNCGKPVKVDWHLTKLDLQHDQVGEREYFCDSKCKEDYISDSVCELEGMNYFICKKILAAAWKREEEEIDPDDVWKNVNNNLISENEGRDHRLYYWYLDSDGIEVIYDLEAGKMITGEEAVKFSEEQFA